MTMSGATGASPKRVSKLVKLLAAEQEFTSIEIAETLWLALQIEAAEIVPEEEDSSQSDSPNLLSTTIDEGYNSESPPPPPPPQISPRANIAAPIPQAGVLPPQTLAVWLTDPAMLTDSLAIVRALKPLLQKVDSGSGKQLDESATVDNIARTLLCLPILKPEQEPWFDIILVVDRGSSMHIWQRLVKDVVRILRRYGAFRDVQVFDLVVNQAAQSTDDVVRLISNPQRPGHRPSELIDQQGRRIVILLSDCAGTYWWDGTLLPMLQDWGNIMPMVVWQMLPAWMWKRTALGRGTAVAVSNDIPGAANQRLKTRIQKRNQSEDANRRIAVPVVTSEVRDLARWSLMVAGDRREVIPGFLLPPKGGSVPRSKGIEEIAHDRAQQMLAGEGDTDIDDAYNQALEAIASERVQRFLELASPQAQRLIMLLAAAPVITLPVVRLICEDETQSPLPVAEVFLSGLLLRLPGQEEPELEQVLQREIERRQTELDQQDWLEPDENESNPMQLGKQDLVQYDFAPRVRDVLLKVLPAVDKIDVINKVSAAVERCWNRVSTENFRAFLMNPNIEVPDELKGLRSFASITADILEPLGGEYASFVRQLRQGAGGELPPPEPGQEEHSFPDLETLEFTIAQLVDPETISLFPPLQTQEVEVVTILIEAEFEELQSFEFESATIERRANAQRAEPSPTGWLQNLFRPGVQRQQPPVEWVIRRQQRQAQRWIEPLGDNLQLEVVSIPSGSFLMGSSKDETERTNREDPQHKVRVVTFLIGRYLVTQAQWKFVAGLPQVKQKLTPAPSRFKGDTRPVERVSWYDAVEFCTRLSQHTGQEYRLPTEAEWEYACRAGTTTPFSFGSMLTTDLANYNGIYTYRGGPKGENRQETTVVDHFGVANAFGLCDMHGNVLEWCEDHWHNNYNGAPTDGSAWLSADNTANRVIRGGSWDNNLGYCRSAYRSNGTPDNAFSTVGFRVVCSAPRTL